MGVTHTRQEVAAFLSLLSTLPLKRLQLCISWEERIEWPPPPESLRFQELVQEMEQKEGHKLHYEYLDCSGFFSLWEP